MPGVLDPAWSRSDLKRPVPLLAAIAGLAATTPVAIVIGCNVHEMAHAAVATILGWEVERVHLCLPAGGRVEYAWVGTWAFNLQGYAGGLAAALFLVAAYMLIFSRGSKPLRGPGWWFAGLGLAIPVGPQVVNGVLEGAVAPGEDYTQVYASVIPLLIVVAMISSAAVHVWRWRVVWTRE